LLEQADVPIRPAEFLFYVPIFAVVIGLVAGVASAGSPVAWSRSRRLSRHSLSCPGQSASAASRRSTNQLPDALNLPPARCAPGSRSGKDSRLANEAIEPMKRSCTVCSPSRRLGRSVDAALEDCATRMESHDCNGS